MNEHQARQQEHESAPVLRPSIWIGSLADYNAGRLHGDWVDAAVEADELHAAAQAVLASSREPGAEEWAVFDSDDFGLYQVNEYDALDRVAAVARGIVEHGRAFAVWAESVRSDEPERLDDFEEYYLGHFDSEEDWGREVLDDGTLDAELDRAIPDSLRSYVSVDYAAFARDARLGGDVWIEDDPTGGVWIFRSL